MSNNNRRDYYLGNPRLRRSGVKVSMTKDQISEFRKCRKDPIYFVTHYMKIRHVDKGLIPFDLYDYQKKLLLHLKKERFSIVTTCRQAGKTSTTVAFFLWYILFNQHKVIGILANKGSTAKEILGRLKLAYEELPKWLQQGVEVWNKGNIELENGCAIIAASTSSSAVRGYSFSMVFVDEAAFVPMNIWDAFYKSTYPTISSGKETKFILVSTPNGLNHYYHLWENANKKDGEIGKSMYAPFSVTWRDVPGRDDAWRSETIGNTDEEAFRQEHELEFIGNANTLIPSSKIKAMVSREAEWIKDNFRIYNEVKKGHIYVLVADTSRGRGLDYSAFSVIDVTVEPYVQVATYRDNNISSMVYPSVIFNAATYYNEAEILVEINDIGEEIANTLHYDLEYENMIWIEQGRGKLSKLRLGVRTTKSVKAVGCSSLDDLIRNDALTIQDQETILELSGFVRKGISYEADAGYTDDLVMGLVLFSWFAKQPLFEQLTDQDLRSRLFQSRIDQLEEELTPLPIIDNGIEIPASIDSSTKWLQY